MRLITGQCLQGTQSYQGLQAQLPAAELSKLNKEDCAFSGR